MKYIIINTDAKYTKIQNHIFFDDDLSLKAKGLYCVLLSKPKTWQCTIKKLENICKENKNTISKALKELEEHKYLIREFKRNNGKIKGVEYTIYSEPMKEVIQ